MQVQGQIAGQNKVNEVDLLYNTVGVKSTMTSKVIKSHFYSSRFTDENPNMEWDNESVKLLWGLKWTQGEKGHFEISITKILMPIFNQAQWFFHRFQFILIIVMRWLTFHHYLSASCPCVDQKYLLLKSA